MKREHQAKRSRDLPPTHPGRVLREDMLPELRLSVSETARRLRISRQTLHRILAEEAPVTPAMALRIGRFCGNGPALWLRLQQGVDLWSAEREMADELAAIEPADRGAA